MTNSQGNPKVDAFLDSAQKWREEYKALRTIVLASGLTEDLKWGVPCYALDNKNIVLIHGFKDYCALLFFKGALLEDPHGVLIQQTQNVQAARQIRFTGIQDVLKKQAVVKDYIQQAVEIEKSGAKVSFKNAEDFSTPEEFQSRLDETPALKAAFQTLTPGRQRAYKLHFSSAKQSKTRQARIEQCIPRILAGKGLDD
jgi:uncharacterized protein YdeI (YjbR/CyaY-like superfamily)